MFGTGLRTGECLALRWEDYDGETLTIDKQVVRRRLENYTKTSVRRKVFVPQWVRNTSTACRRGSLGTLSSLIRTTPITKTQTASMMVAGSSQKPESSTIPYTCRRAAELLSAGVAPAAAAKQLGHTTEIFLRTYSEFLEGMRIRPCLTRQIIKAGVIDTFSQGGLK